MTGCSRQETAAANTADDTAAQILQVEVAAAETRKVERTVLLSGSLLPDESVNLSAEVQGTLRRFTADFGQNVRKGEVLAELDPRELTLQRDRARAALAQALARIGLGPDDVEADPESTPGVRQARAQYEDVKFKYESASKLVESGDISRERFTEIEKLYRSREAGLQGARDEVRTQLAVIAGLRADLQLFEKRLSDTFVRAPFDGAVVERMVSPGQFMKENTPILRIVKTHPLRLRLDVPESDMASVRPGKELTFVTDAIPGREFRATVRELNPSLDARSRSLTAEARLAGAPGELKPGMFVQARLLAGQEERIAVPAKALYRVAGLTKVYAVRDGIAVECKVQPREEQDGWIVLESGSLSPGDMVATSNLGALADGMKVNPGRG